MGNEPQSRMSTLGGDFEKKPFADLAKVLLSGRPGSQGIRNGKDLRGSRCYPPVFHIRRDPKMQILFGSDENPVDLRSASRAL